ncbi:MAG: hypothetical protein IJF73_07080 [Clostridia bacterium]|nr:hypothetical protein [Clostridia bacterium]
MAGETPDLSGLLGGLLSQPQALAGLRNLVANLGEAGGREAPPPEGSREQSEAALPVVAPPLPPKGGRHSERSALLCALSPYLSPPRRRALDGAVRILEILELFEDKK